MVPPLLLLLPLPLLVLQRLLVPLCRRLRMQVVTVGHLQLLAPQTVGRPQTGGWTQALGQAHGSDRAGSQPQEVGT